MRLQVPRDLMPTIVACDGVAVSEIGLLVELKRSCMGAA